MRSNRRYWFDSTGNSRFQGHFQGQSVDKYKNLDIGRDFYFRLYDLDLGRDYYFKLDSLDVGRDFFIDSRTRKNIDVGRDYYVDNQLLVKFIDIGQKYIIDGEVN